MSKKQNVENNKEEIVNDKVVTDKNVTTIKTDNNNVEDKKVSKSTNTNTKKSTKKESSDTKKPLKKETTKKTTKKTDSSTKKSGKHVKVEEKETKKKETSKAKDQDNKTKKQTKTTEVKVSNTKKKDVKPKEVSKTVKKGDNKVEEVSKIVKEEDIKISDNETKKSHKIFPVSILVILILLIFIFIFSTIFALITSNKTTIIQGVKIKDIDVSGLTKEQAIEKVSSNINEKLQKSFTLKHNDYELEVFANQFSISFNIENAVNTAFLKGRSDNIFKSNYEILLSMLSETRINPGFSYSDDILDSLIAEMETNFDDRLIESNYYIDGNNLIISKGKNGVVIDKNKLISEIIYYINNFNTSSPIINIPVIEKTATPLDLQKIYSEISRAPQDAYYTTNPYVVHPHVDGIDFAISFEEAKNIFESSKDSECTIPLKLVPPNVTTNQIGPEAFPDLLGSYSTTFSTSNVNRSTNIRLATAKINGTVIMPNETFSYNQVVGKRTTSAGFKAAAVYAGGEVTTGIGGGICQVSSTLYNSVLLANLEIIERFNHGFNTGYVPAGRDATVSWGGPDFKFKNTRNYPVRIDASVSGGKILVNIFGLKGENEYQVEIQSYITSYIKYQTIQKNDPTLPKGQTKVIQNGSNGCRSVCYRILKQNGEIISKTLLSNDTYNPHNKIVAVGTK